MLPFIGALGGLLGGGGGGGGAGPATATSTSSSGGVSFGTRNSPWAIVVVVAVLAFAVFLIFRRK